jgi:hypothetical protein
MAISAVPIPVYNLQLEDLFRWTLILTRDEEGDPIVKMQARVTVRNSPEAPIKLDPTRIALDIPLNNGQQTLLLNLLEGAIFDYNVNVLGFDPGEL